MSKNYEGIKGNLMRTVDGKYIDFANPQPDQISLHAIATGLGSECRFGNQLHEHYSVAEHCVHCLTVANHRGLSVETKRAVLMHDAAEAFCKDIPKPLKILLPNYKIIEDWLQRVIEAKYGIANDEETRKAVKEIDLAVLKAEKTALTSQDEQHDLSDVPDVDIDFQCYNRNTARYKFISVYVALRLSDA